MNPVKAIISRQKYWAHGMKAEWKWLYSVQLIGVPSVGLDAQSAPVSIGTRIDEAMGWAKRKGAKVITKEWAK